MAKASTRGGKGRREGGGSGKKETGVGGWVIREGGKGHAPPSPRTQTHKTRCGRGEARDRGTGGRRRRGWGNQRNAEHDFLCVCFLFGFNSSLLPSFLLPLFGALLEATPPTCPSASPPPPFFLGRSAAPSSFSLLADQCDGNALLMLRTNGDMVTTATKSKPTVGVLCTEGPAAAWAEIVHAPSLLPAPPLHRIGPYKTRAFPSSLCA